MPSTRGGVHVQVASVSAQEDVEPEWRRLRRKHPDLLGPLALDVQRAELEMRTVYRLLAGPLDDRAQAEQLCRQLETRGAGCLVRDAR